MRIRNIGEGAELDRDWIHPWIRSGFSGNFMDWIGWDDCGPVFNKSHFGTSDAVSFKL